MRQWGHHLQPPRRLVASPARTVGLVCVFTGEVHPLHLEQRLLEETGPQVEEGRGGGGAAWQEAEVWVNSATGASPSQGVSMGVRLLCRGWGGKEVARELPPGPRFPRAGPPGQTRLCIIGPFFFVLCSEKGTENKPPLAGPGRQEQLCLLLPHKHFS